MFWGHCALLELSSSRDWILDCMSIISSLSVKIVVTSFWQWNHNLSHLKETNNIRKSSIMQSIKQPLGSQSHCNINLTHQGRISLMFWMLFLIFFGIRIAFSFLFYFENQLEVYDNYFFLDFLIQKYGKFWRILLDNFVKNKPVISECCCTNGPIFLWFKIFLSKSPDKNSKLETVCHINPDMMEKEAQLPKYTKRTKVTTWL